MLSFVIAVTILHSEYMRHQKGVSQTVVLTQASPDHLLEIKFVILLSQLYAVLW
jgi:hypothetical protein